MIDTAKIEVRAGKGGAGSASLRREKYIPKGGPDGGDGGDGGDIVCLATREINTLTDFHRLTKYKAPDGEAGQKKKMHGAGGKDLVIRVPVGTILRDSRERTVADLTCDGEKVVLARGGRGGKGNVHFATATHQTPREFEPGQEGDEAKLGLELKLLADVGLIGLPNAGKSTLLSVLTNAKPKIADYPFTTLEPILGVAHHKKITYVIADIPGLIEGAAGGKGLGDQFLRHVERTKVLVHLVRADSDDPAGDYGIIRKELELFSPSLTRKKEIVVLSQADRVSSIMLRASARALKKTSSNIIALSARGHLHLDDLRDKIIELL